MFKATASGFGEIRAMLERLPAKVGEEKIAEALHAAAEPTADLARSLCPRGTATSNRFQRKKHRLGHLADSIRVFDLPPSGGKVRVAVSYPKTYFYGHFVEWGTAAKAGSGAQTREKYQRVNSKGQTVTGYRRARQAERGHHATAAHPFLRPAWDADKHEYLPRFGELVWFRLSEALPSGWRRG